MKKRPVLDIREAASSTERAPGTHPISADSVPPRRLIEQTGEPLVQKDAQEEVQDNYPNRESIKADSDFVTDRLSTQARGLGFGTIAVIWASLNAKPESIKLEPHLAIWVASFAIATLIFDLLQYVVAYELIQRFDRDLKFGREVTGYEHWGLYRLRVMIFRAKVLLAGMTAIGLLLIVWLAIQ